MKKPLWVVIPSLWLLQIFVRHRKWEMGGRGRMKGRWKCNKTYVKHYTYFGHFLATVVPPTSTQFIWCGRELWNLVVVELVSGFIPNGALDCLCSFWCGRHRLALYTYCKRYFFAFLRDWICLTCFTWELRSKVNGRERIGIIRFHEVSIILYF